MNKDNAAQYLPLVQALADGKVIQHYSGFKDSKLWVDCGNVEFTSPPERFRIKPEPREWWICVGTFGQVAGVHYSKHTADHWAAAHADLKVVHVREVTQ